MSEDHGGSEEEKDEKFFEDAVNSTEKDTEENEGEKMKTSTAQENKKNRIKKKRERKGKRKVTNVRFVWRTCPGLAISSHGSRVVERGFIHTVIKIDTV